MPKEDNTFQDERCWRVVIVYDDPRGGTWRGPLECKGDAEDRYAKEVKTAHGRVWLERI